MSRPRRARPTPPRREPEKVDPTTLKLDAKNPRFAALHSAGRPTERDIIRELQNSANLPELLLSIAANGYQDFEPLIVMEEDKGELTVIEGNRRVAAIKLLRSPELAEDVGVEVPVLGDAMRQTLQSVSAIRVKDRAEARQYIGFKHINGPHKWDSFVKAKYAADWYRKERANGVTIRDIARQLGDRHDTILRLVQGVYALEQAQEHGLFTPDDLYPGRPFAFSHLYTALALPQYRSYLGLDLNWRQTDPKPDPVPEARLPELKKILTWIYGSEVNDQPPLVTSQNPHIKQLGDVLENKLALKRLEATNELSKAYAEVESRSRRFEENLIKAVGYAEDAQQYVDAFEGDPALVEYAERLNKIGHLLLRALRTESKE